MVGDSGVGKSSFCNTYIGMSVVKDYNPSIGLNVYQKNHILPGTEGESFPIELWDIGGDACESRYFANAVFSADVVFMMYDITDIGSFQRLKEIMEMINSFFGIDKYRDTEVDIRKPYLGLIGNKSKILLISVDLLAYRAVSIEMHSNFFNDGQFNSDLICSSTKRDLIQTWILQVINAFSTVSVDPSYFFKIPGSRAMSNRSSLIEDKRVHKISKHEQICQFL